MADQLRRGLRQFQDKRHNRLVRSIRDKRITVFIFRPTKFPRATHNIKRYDCTRAATCVREKPGTTRLVGTKPHSSRHEGQGPQVLRKENRQLCLDCNSRELRTKTKRSDWCPDDHDHTVYMKESKDDQHETSASLSTQHQ